MSSTGDGTTGTTAAARWIATRPETRPEAGAAEGAPSPGHVQSPLATVFPGESEMAARSRAFHWAATPLGPPDGWPAALRSAVRQMLATPVATSLWCGPSYTLLYNDAYRRILGMKHPDALARSGAAVWDELWPALEPQFAQVRAGGPPVYEDESLLHMERLAGGAGEDAWFTYALSALTDDDGTGLAVHNVAVETTARVLAERRQRALLAELAAERARLRGVILQAPVPMALHEGPEHRYALVNAAFRRVSGGRDVTGLTIREAFPEIAGQGVWELFDRVYATGDPWVGPETRVHYDRLGTGTAEDAWFDLRYEAVRDEHGRVAGILNLSVDVTDHVRARREIERLLAESERARGAAEAAARALAERTAEAEDARRTARSARGPPTSWRRPRTATSRSTPSSGSWP